MTSCSMITYSGWICKPSNSTVHHDDTKDGNIGRVGPFDFESLGWCHYRRYSGNLGYLIDSSWNCSYDHELRSGWTIHPARIEELVRNRHEIDNKIRWIWRAAAYEIASNYIQTWWRLWDVGSSALYGNVLRYPIEVASWMGIMASELGEMHGLSQVLHDRFWPWGWGYRWNRMELARKHKEHPVVVNMIASHHGDVG